MLKIFVIDGDDARRGRLCRMLINHRLYCEPYDSIEEFVGTMPPQGLVLYCDENGDVAQLIERIEQRSWLPVIAYAECADMSRAVRAMQAGVASYMAFPFSAEEVLHEYGLLEAGFVARFAHGDRVRAARRLLDTLSKREREILGCMLDHGTSKQIARYLGISPRTVEAHRANLMARLDVRTATQAIRLAIEGEAYAGPPAIAGKAHHVPRELLQVAPVLQ